MSAILHFVSRGRRRDIAGRRGRFFLVPGFWASFHSAPAAWPVNSVCSTPATGFSNVQFLRAPARAQWPPCLSTCDVNAVHARPRWQGNPNYSCALFSSSAGLSPRKSFPTGIPIWTIHTRHSNRSRPYPPASACLDPWVLSCWPRDCGLAPAEQPRELNCYLVCCNHAFSF